MLHFATPESESGFVPHAVTPTELPDIRRHMSYMAHDMWRINPDNSRSLRLAHMRDDLDAAELFHVSEDFCALVAAAHDSMPDHVLTQFDPPARSGLALVAKPSGSATPRYLGDVAGWFWSVRADGLYIALLVDRRSQGQPFSVAPYFYYAEHVIRASWGRVFDSLTGSVCGSHAEDTARLLWVSNLVVFWNLLRQQSLVQDAAIAPSRATRRREEKAGRTPSAVRVITLAGSCSNESSGDKSREWRHRWVVRGHWRKQWYPSIEDHRPVWIAPHLKGPGDAPLLGGQKVYAVKAPPQEVTS